MVTCFALTSYTDPGVITHSERDYRDCLLAGERGVSADGLCTTCMIRKPLRSKHDSVMNVCIAEFDHFCPWCNNAVGHCNYLPFVGWCVFQGINHAQAVYLFSGWLMSEIGAESVFPIVGNLVKMNAMQPSVLYLGIFQILCTLMALQLSLFQFGNIGVNLTTNERMNAFRYSYLMEYASSGLKGNPYDHGGFKKNFMMMLKRGIFTKLPKVCPVTHCISCRHHVCILPSVSLPRHTAAINHTHIQHHCTQNQSKASLYKASHDHCF